MGKDWELQHYFTNGNNIKIGNFDEADAKKIMKHFSQYCCTIVAFNWRTRQAMELHSEGFILKNLDEEKKDY